MMGREIISMVARGRANRRGLTTKRDKGTFQSDTNVFILIVGVVTWLYMCKNF